MASEFLITWCLGFHLDSTFFTESLSTFRKTKFGQNFSMIFKYIFRIEIRSIFNMFSFNVYLVI